MIYVFTTCAMNYYPNSVLLARSIELHLPNARLVLCIADRTPPEVDPIGDGFHEVYPLSHIAEHVPNLDQWVYQHTVMELATAVKPFVLADLLERDDCDGVVFFDPDCEVYSDCQIIQNAVAKHSVVLTPHANLPHVNNPWVFFEMNNHRVGVYNGGFFGVRADEEGKSFARWWRHRLTDHCLIDDKRRLFTDQKWLDFVPCYFDNVKVLRQPTLNLARWNTFQRKVTRASDGSVLVDGTPVDFVHYSGFLKKGAYVRGLYDATSAKWCEDIAILDALSEAYADRLQPLQAREECQQPWGFASYSDGVAIPDDHRRKFHQSEPLRSVFTNPFEGGDALRASLSDKPAQRAKAAGQPEPAPRRKRSLVDKLLGRRRG